MSLGGAKEAPRGCSSTLMCGWVPGCVCLRGGTKSSGAQGACVSLRLFALTEASWGLKVMEACLHGGRAPHLGCRPQGLCYF